MLQDSNQDLKYAFHFLIQKHKATQNELNKEKLKSTHLNEIQERLADVTAERDEAYKQAADVRTKFNAMNRVVALAVREQAHQDHE